MIKCKEGFSLQALILMSRAALWQCPCHRCVPNDNTYVRPAVTMMNEFTSLQMHHACIIYPFNSFLADHYSSILYVYCLLAPNTVRSDRVNRR